MHLIVAGWVGWFIFGSSLLHKGFVSVLKTYGGYLRLCPATRVVWGHPIFHSCLPHLCPRWYCFDILPVEDKHPQSWSVLWRRMIKLKYTYLSVDFHISPSKMARSSHDPEGASGNYKSAHQNGHQDTLNSDFLMSLFLAWQWPSLRGGAQKHHRNACTSPSSCTKAPSLWCQRPVTFYFLLSKQSARSPQGSECSPSRHWKTGNKPRFEKPDSQVSTPSPELSMFLNMVMWLVFLIYLQGAFFSQWHPSLNPTEMSLHSLGMSVWFLNKGKWMAGPEGLAPLYFSFRVQLPPPSLLYDPTSTYDALSQHLHHL